MEKNFARLTRVSLATVALAVTSAAGVAQEKSTARPEFPPHADVLKGYEKVASPDGRSLYTLFTRKKDNQMYAELPRTFLSKKYFFAVTLASGDRYAGLQLGDRYLYWRRFDKRLALIEPNLGTRADGDKYASTSVKRLFTDRILLDVPIVTIGPGGGPVIDMDALLVGKSRAFFGSNFTPHPIFTRYNMYTIKTAKAFPQNIEVAFEVPSGSGFSSSFSSSSSGRLKTLHYSISEVPEKTGYKPRKADERVGFFTTSYSDLSKYNDRETVVRFINRWNLQKANPALKVSPPKKPIVFYIEKSTPIRYRRWVKNGILAWNAAFEKVGISDAIEVEYHDSSAENLKKDPEDVRYNFVRWLNNDVGTAIGPSRVHPMTGEILDADIILTDGWIRHYRMQFSEILPKIAMEGFSPDTLRWLSKHPKWDPRIRLAAPSQRDHLAATFAQDSLQPHGGHPMSKVDATLIGDDEFDGLVGRTSQVNGMCKAADGLSLDMSMMRMHFALLAAAADEDEDDKKKDEDEKDKDAEDGDKKKDDAKKDADKDGDKKDDAKKDDDKKKEEAKKDEEKKPEKPAEQMIDGMPESFVGPLVAHLVAHEVGHTLGLRHNFKASSVYGLNQINSKELKGAKSHAGSVMDYLPVNMNLKSGETQGDWTMLGVGPYDMWAIEYGYSFAKDLKPILARVAEPELVYATDEDTWGPDPLARRYDFSKNPLDYANNQMRLAKFHRKNLIEKFVKDGDSWSRAREGYELTLSFQTRAISMMANWIGGAHVHRDKKGDKNGRKPIEVVPVETQRKALAFVMENAFQDKAFDLTPELLQHMSVDKWLDVDSFHFFNEESTFPVHDRIMGIQASALTMLMNPDTLERVYDNELFTPQDKDMLTLAELLGELTKAVWSELDQKPDKKHSAREPMISSLRRNLQREHLERLIDLTLPGAGSSPAYKPIANLSIQELKGIAQRIEKLQAGGADKQDAYTSAHLSHAANQIEKALDAQYIYNNNSGGGSGGGLLLFFKEQLSRQQQETP